MFEACRMTTRILRPWFAAALILAASLLAAQDAKPAIPAGELVRQAVAREVAANNASVKHMFRSRKQTPRGSQTRLYVETKESMAGMLIAINDQPLTAEQEQAEAGHLQWLADNPDVLRKKHARENEDAERTLRMVKAFPDAFRYEYAGSENGTATMGKPGDSLVRLNFTPNPDYSPPSREEQVLTGMQGYVLIDRDAMRLARIDGTLFKDVTFGWGIFGRLDRGGHFRVLQADVGDGTWDITEMDLKFTGKILMFKNLNMVSDEVLSDFRQVPENTTFAQGVAMLKAAEEKTNGQRADRTAAKK
jgi:hypothetical protein